MLGQSQKRWTNIKSTLDQGFFLGIETIIMLILCGYPALCSKEFFHKHVHFFQLSTTFFVHYIDEHIFNPNFYSAGIDFSLQNLTSVDVRF